MVQKSTPRSDRRGRPPEYDTAAVVAAATNAFFKTGFEGTTLADLEQATGVDRSTLYNSFGGKAGLYGMATDAYLDQAERGLFGPLHDGTDDGLADIAEFLRRLRSGLTNPAMPAGCLVVNDMASGSDPEAARRYMELLETGARAALSRSGMTEIAEIERRAQLITASVIGANLVSKTTGDRARVGELVSALAAEVQSWRKPGHDQPHGHPDSGSGRVG